MKRTISKVVEVVLVLCLISFLVHDIFYSTKETICYNTYVVKQQLDNNELARQVLYPNVRIAAKMAENICDNATMSLFIYNVDEGEIKDDTGLPIDPDWYGSGTVIFVDKIGAVVLTAKHVTMDSGQIFVQAFVRESDTEDAVVKNYEAFILREEAGNIDEEYDTDVSLLRVPGLTALPVAHLSTHGVRLGERVYGAHCDLGAVPFLTNGFVSQLPGDDEAKDLFSCSLNSMPGASGSGVYVFRDNEYQLVGVLVRGYNVGYGIPAGFMTMCVDWPRIEHLLKWALVLRD